MGIVYDKDEEDALNACRPGNEENNIANGDFGDNVDCGKGAFCVLFNPRGQQAAPARLRQAHDLLPYRR